jgi:dihydrodipicolinate synthase/N-acetylneuraminate lyase
MMNNLQQLHLGVIPAMATPLQDDGYQLSQAGLEKLIPFLVEAGVAGLFVGGTTGEGILLDTAVRQQLHAESIAICGRQIPILLHVGANRLDEAVTLARHAAELEAEAIVAVTPYFYPVGDDGLLAYFQAIAAAAPETPLFAYDIPQQATNGISLNLLRQLAERIPSLAGVKTSRGDAQYVRQLIDAAPSHVAVFAGNERIALGLLALGATGLISGLATAVPEPFVALTQAVKQNDLAAAQAQQKQINQLLDRLPAGARIGAIKQILQQRGIPAGPAVPPRPMPAPEWRLGSFQ